MDDTDNVHVGWSEKQWDCVNTTVQEEAQKARIAAQFIPTNLYPDATAIAIPNRTLQPNFAPAQPPPPRLVVDHDPQTFFTSLSVNVVLRSQEVADPQQAAALLQFRRAANLIARLEDALVFNGRPGPGLPPPG